MKINVSVNAAIRATRPYTPTEAAILLRANPAAAAAIATLGQVTSPDVAPTMLVSEFINLLVTQLGFQNAMATYNLECREKDTLFNPALTLEAAGVLTDDCVELRVIFDLM